MEVTIKRLNKLIKEYTKNNENDLIKKLEKKLELIDKMILKLCTYDFKNNFTIFYLNNYDKIKIFHICNRTRNYIKDLLNYLFDLNQIFINKKEIIEEILLIIKDCIKKIFEIESIIITILDKKGFKEKSDCRINKINENLPNYSIIKILTKNNDEDEDEYENKNKDDNKINNKIEEELSSIKKIEKN